MITRRITDPGQMTTLYRQHVRHDFPPRERPPERSFRKMVKNPRFTVTLYLKDEREVGYTVVYEKEGYLLLNYFAVYEELRGKGIGTEILAELARQYAGKQAVYLEAEHRDYAKNEEDARISQSRIRFYQRNGYHLMEDMDVVLFRQHYHLMVLPLQNQKAAEDKDFLFRMMQDAYRGITRTPQLLQRRLLYLNER